jgi:DNA invertase Pin-like site-specific DNA recombinase
MTTLSPRKGSLTRPDHTLTDIRQDPRVVCPIRVSTDHQIYGPIAQLDALTSHCEKHQLKIHDTYQDHISAKEAPFLDRPGVQAMLADMRQHDIRRILVTKVDRAFRSTADFLITCNALDKLGHLIQVADLGLDSGTAHGRMVIGILAQLGEWELTMRSERQLAAFQVMRDQRRPCSGTIRYAWAPDPDAPGQLLPVPAEQRILADIIVWHNREKLTPSQIATRLTNAGTPKTYRRYRLDGQGTRHLIETSSQWSRRGVASIIEHAELAEA